MADTHGAHGVTAPDWAGATGAAGPPATAPDSSSRSSAGDTVIRTPDQRVRVFVSSTLQELAPERATAREAVTKLRLTPVLFELGARPHPPRDLYRAYLAQSDVFIGLYWQRYGWVAPGMDVSGLEDEYQLSGDRPKLIYVKAPAPDREPGLTALLNRVRDDDTASYKPFTTADELRELIENDLALLLTEHFALARGTSLPSRETPGLDHLLTNLPVQRSPLVNRTAEVTTARALLLHEDAGLVTFTGAGGSGKTRLALHVAATLREDFADGVFLVSLAPIADPRLVASAIAQTLEIHESGGHTAIESLKEYLRTKRMLLVLDNFEQVIPAADLVSDLLATCPQLKVLATSRAALRVRGERIVPVTPLALPDRASRPDLARLSQYAAVELFIQRARDVKPDFVISNQTAPAVAEICYRLDGLPLAIELAAARIKLLPPQALLARLEWRLPLLTGGARDLPARQQTLRSAIAWSYDLLEESEKTLFRRLAVFVGGCTLEAVDAVCNAAGDLEIDVLDGVAALLDKSLLQRSAETTVEWGGDGEPRFEMLETIREYGLEALSAHGETDSARRQHAGYFLALAEAAEPALAATGHRLWLGRLEAEHDNLRAALAWARQRQDAESGLRLSGALWWFWHMHGHLTEGRTWLEEFLALDDGGDSHSGTASARAKALTGAGALAWSQGDYAHATALATDSLALFRTLHDRRGSAVALLILGNVLNDQGHWERATEQYEDSLASFRALGDQGGTALALTTLGNVALNQGDLERATARYEESLVLSRQLGATWNIANLLNNLGAVAHDRGDWERATARFEEGLALRRDMGDRLGMALALSNLGEAARARGASDRALAAYRESLALLQTLGHKEGIASCLEGLADVALGQGRPELAVRLCGAATALLDAVGVPRDRPERAGYDRIAAAARTALMERSQSGESAFAAEWAAGQQLPLEEAITQALGISATSEMH